VVDTSEILNFAFIGTKVDGNDVTRGMWWIAGHSFFKNHPSLAFSCIFTSHATVDAQKRFCSWEIFLSPLHSSSTTSHTISYCPLPHHSRCQERTCIKTSDSNLNQPTLVDCITMK
jgi:hypothetical protein